MTFLLTGGSANGKSTYARRIAKHLCEKRTIVSTEIDRELRCDGFDAVSRYTGIGNVLLPPVQAVIIECLCNLTANEMFEPDGAGEDTANTVVADIMRLSKRYSHLVVVTNEIGSDGAEYDGEVNRYIRTLGEINRRLAAALDNVYELCAGIPVVLRGGRILEPDKGGESVTLIIGGRASGRREYAKTLGFTDDDIADGMLDGRPVLYNLQNIVAQNPESATNLLPELLEKRIIICDEVGCGIIPVNEAETAWRVATGALCSELAARANSVVRVVCGIPVALK